MKNIKEEGSITLETALVLPIFFFMFLFIYGLFSVYSSQNRMTHALIQSAKSLSLDSYMAENVESAAERGTAFWGGFGDMVIDFGDFKDALKKLTDALDHSFIFETGSLKETTLTALKEEGFLLHEVPFRPTA